LRRSTFALTGYGGHHPSLVPESSLRGDAIRGIKDGWPAIRSSPEASGFGIAHRDLGRRLNDMIVADFDPTPSVIAGVNGPCDAIDTSLDGLRRLQTTSVAELNAMLARAGLTALPVWTPPAAPACGPK
jgi:hypothetical protein